MAIDKNKLIKVTNRYSGTVGYDVQDMAIPHRNFFPDETKEVTYEELEKVAADPAGFYQLKEHLVIEDKEAAAELLYKVEPEYWYSKARIKKLLTTPNNYDEFLDCLDFAPEGVIDIIKNMAVDLPINDIAKREAIKEKTGFDVTRAIEVKNTKYDGEEQEAETKEAPKKRRVATAADDAPKRRVVITKD